MVNHDANLDPKFAGLGYDGYLTTVSGVRGRLYHGVIPATGHSLHESTTAPITTAAMLAWSYTTARP